MVTIVVNEGTLDLVDGASISASFSITDLETGVLLELTQANIDAAHLQALMSQKRAEFAIALTDATNQDIAHVWWRDPDHEVRQLS